MLAKQADGPFVNHRYTGARTKNHRQGYLLEHCPSHPACDRFGFLMQHRLVMEVHLGRFLKGVEVVHHIDDNPSNNALENLMLFASQSAHRQHHIDRDGLSAPDCVVQRLRDLAGTVSQKQAGVELGMHQSMVSHLCSVHGIHWPRHGLLKVDEEWLGALLQQYTAPSVATALGMKNGSLHNRYPHLMPHGTSRKRRKSTCPLPPPTLDDLRGGPAPRF